MQLESAIVTLDSNPDMTMTLKEITDILKVRHDNATRTVNTMTKNPKFGACPQTEVMVEIGSGAKRAVLTSNQVRVTANGLATIAELTECDFENGDLDHDPFGLAIV